jgi:hypothetical protein
MTRVWQKASTAAILLLLLATAYNGTVEGLNATRYASSIGQRIASVTQLAYGALAIAAILGIALRHPMTITVLVAWGGAVVSTAALAPVVYAGASASVGLGAGLAAAVVAAGAIEAWRRGRRPPSGLVPPAA